MEDIRIIAPIGVLSSGEGNWQKELNVVSVDGGPFQYDLREWSLDHTESGNGLSLNNDETLVLQALLKECFKEGEEIDLTQLAEKHRPSYEQTKLPGMENDGNPEQDDTKLFDLFKANKLEYIDKRSKGGALWVPGNHELDKIMMECLDLGYKFYFSEKGGRVTKNEPSWYLPAKKQK